MSWDSPDRRSMEIPQDRIDRVIGAVFARLDQRGHLVAARPNIVERIRDWLSRVIPAPRFAMPMMAAALLGVMVGRHLQMTDAALQFADLFSYTSITALGF
ncbi:MAG: hypothetical protein Q7R40_00470 [Phaeospirillum sp.]|nr:hypothetical protein [Phaeospirillum sp.]